MADCPVKSALLIIQQWIRDYEKQTIQLNYNKAIQEITFRINKNVLTEFQLVKLSVIPLEHLLPDVICERILSFLSICEKLRNIRVLNKYWNSKIHIKIDAVFNTLSLNEMQHIFDNKRFGIYLHCGYNWSAMGFNEVY